MKFGVYLEVDEWCMTVYSTTRFKVKDTSPWKSENNFKRYLLPIYNGGWQMTPDS